jgi:hypothetical protein
MRRFRDARAAIFIYIRAGEKPKAKKPPRKTRSGSEQRKLQPRITFRVDEPLRAKAQRDSAAMGFTVGSYIRMLLGDEYSMRPQRRPLPSEILLAQLKPRPAMWTATWRNC